MVATNNFLSMMENELDKSLDTGSVLERGWGFKDLDVNRMRSVDKYSHSGEISDWVGKIYNAQAIIIEYIIY